MAELFVQVGALKIWTESFGDKKNPPILLIMGAAAQGIFVAASSTPTGVLSNVASASGSVAGISFTDVTNQTATATYTVATLSWPRGRAVGL